MHADTIRRGARVDTVWSARITHESGRVSAIHGVHRTDHSKWLTSVPATARWRWLDTDEDVWVGCDIGCCLISSWR
jgi:hypothetical protein